MRRCSCGRMCRLSTMLCMTSTFFLVELIFGHIVNSLALISDSYHMLSDVVAIVIAMVSIQVSKLRSPKNTYGWVRAEVLGALVNSVFLLALCFAIVVEAIQRLTTGDTTVKDPDTLLYVGIVGLVFNLIALALFHTHGTSDKSRCTRAVNRSSSKRSTTSADKSGTETGSGIREAASRTLNADVEAGNGQATYENADLHERLTMRGVFLHVLGDAISSVNVIISALLIKFIDDEAKWKYKIDPVASLIMAMILCITTMPLFRTTSLILLQTAPTHIHVENLKEKLLAHVEGIEEVHELHVWQLTASRIIATTHIRCRNAADYMTIAVRVKRFFHDEGIHSTTVQPEFTQMVGGQRLENDGCLLRCGSDQSCRDKKCCVLPNP